MFHPLIHLIASRPHLLADHASAYAELVGAELARVSSDVKRRAIYGVVALIGAMVGVVLAGTALMLWAVMPATQMVAPWALLVVPAPALLIAVGCGWAARAPASSGAAFDSVRKQMHADMVMLRESGAS